MGINDIQAKETSFEQPEVGADVGRIVGVIDLGTQQTKAYQSESLVDKHQILIKIELPNQLRTDGTPFTMDKWFAVSLHEKAGFKKFIDTVGITDLTNFNAQTLLGKTMQVEIDQNPETQRCSIKNTAKLMKGILVPAQITESLYFSIDGKLSFESESFNELPEYIRKTIQKSKEYIDQDIFQGTPIKKETPTKEAPVKKETVAQEIDISDTPF